MVVGSSVPGDSSEEDTPDDGVLLLGWHSVDREAQVEASREGVRLSQRQKSCVRSIDVVPYCRPGPSYRRDDEDGGDGTSSYEEHSWSWRWRLSF